MFFAKIMLFLGKIAAEPDFLFKKEGKLRKLDAEWKLKREFL